MTQERFFRILNDPDVLANISYEELKTLALAYPYAHNLRYLLALKAAKIEHPEAARTLSAAAMYSLDRSQLFVFMAPKAIVPQKIMEKEEVLELKPIETVRQELEALSPLPREEKQAETTAAAAAPVPKAEIMEPKPKSPEKSSLDVDKAEVDKEEISEDTAPEINTPPVVPKVVPLAFTDWVNRFHPPVLEKRKPAPAPEPEQEPEPGPLPKTSKAPSLPPEKGVAQKLAERSVAENKDVISETLAKLLAKQGYKDKAVTMYERLCLAFPDKSAYFAAEIEKLKN